MSARLFSPDPISTYPRPRYKPIFAGPRSDDEGVLDALRGGATPVLRKLAISPGGCGDVPVPLRCGFVAVATATASSLRLADTRTPLATRAGGMLRWGLLICETPNPPDCRRRRYAAPNRRGARIRLSLWRLSRQEPRFPAGHRFF